MHEEKPEKKSPPKFFGKKAAPPGIFLSGSMNKKKSEEPKEPENDVIALETEIKKSPSKNTPKAIVHVLEDNVILSDGEEKKRAKPPSPKKSFFTVLDD